MSKIFRLKNFQETFQETQNVWENTGIDFQTNFEHVFYKFSGFF